MTTAPGLSSPRRARREAVRTKRVQRRRRQLLSAATQLMQEMGYHAMSMQLLAERADVSVGLIYQYFTSKEDLLRAVFVDILEDFRDRVPAEVEAAGADPVTRLVSAVGAFCRIIDAKRAGAALAYRESQTLSRGDRQLIKALETATTEPIRQAIRDGIGAGVFRPVDVDLVAHNVLMVAHGWALKHWNLAPRMTIEEYLVGETDLLLASIRTPAISTNPPTLTH